MLNIPHEVSEAAQNTAREYEKKKRRRALVYF